MIWIKIAFVVLLCLPILYFGFTFLNRLLDNAIEKRPKVDPLDDSASGFTGRRSRKTAEKTSEKTGGKAAGRRTVPARTTRAQDESDESLWINPARTRDRETEKKGAGRARDGGRDRDKTDGKETRSRRRRPDAVGAASSNARKTGGRGADGKTRGEKSRERRPDRSAPRTGFTGRRPDGSLDEKKRSRVHQPPLRLREEESRQKPSGRRNPDKRGSTDWDEE